MDVVIKNADKNDLPWINEQYKKIDFLPSSLEEENIVLTQIDGENAGIGRIKRINEDDAELGGIYVLPEFRKYGVARKIVSELVSIGQQYRRIFCLPYEHLKKFYGSFGFMDIDENDLIPIDIDKKMDFCKSTYDTNVLLLLKKNI